MTERQEKNYGEELERVTKLANHLGYPINKEAMAQKRNTLFYQKLVEGLSRFDTNFYKISKLWKMFYFSRSKGKPYQCAISLLKAPSIKITEEILHTIDINRMALAEGFFTGTVEEKLFLLIQNGKIKTIAPENFNTADKLMSNLVFYDEESKTTLFGKDKDAIVKISDRLRRPINFIGTIPKSLKTIPERIEFFKSELDQFAKIVYELSISQNEISIIPKEVQAIVEKKEEVQKVVKKAKKTQEIADKTKKDKKKNKKDKKRKDKGKKKNEKKNEKIEKEKKKRPLEISKQQEDKENNANKKKVKFASPLEESGSIDVFGGCESSEKEFFSVKKSLDEMKILKPILKNIIDPPILIESDTSTTVEEEDRVKEIPLNNDSIILTKDTDFSVSLVWFENLNASSTIVF